ncbi:hypothetical protein G6F35_015667 [Rhizopus arrhizus]|nr:hypothetical protein G6F35_015667 [Rhizopus arrhizus]
MDIDGNLPEAAVHGIGEDQFTLQRAAALRAGHGLRTGTRQHLIQPKLGQGVLRGQQRQRLVLQGAVVGRHDAGRAQGGGHRHGDDGQRHQHFDQGEAALAVGGAGQFNGCHNGRMRRVAGQAVGRDPAAAGPPRPPRFAGAACRRVPGGRRARVCLLPRWGPAGAPGARMTSLGRWPASGWGGRRCGLRFADRKSPRRNSRRSP